MDDALIELYLQRSEAAILQTDAQYGPYCRAIVGSILPRDEDVEECINDIWLLVWNAIPPTQPRNFKAWLGVVSRNAALAKLRRQVKKPAAFPLEELCECLAGGKDPAAEAQAQLLSEAITAFLRDQPQKKRIAFVRRYWYRDSVADVAQRLGWSLGKTKTTLFRLRNRLADELRKEGLLE